MKFGLCVNLVNILLIWHIIHEKSCKTFLLLPLLNYINIFFACVEKRPVLAQRVANQSCAQVNLLPLFLFLSLFFSPSFCLTVFSIPFILSLSFFTSLFLSANFWHEFSSSKIVRIGWRRILFLTFSWNLTFESAFHLAEHETNAHFLL